MVYPGSDKGCIVQISRDMTGWVHKINDFVLNDAKITPISMQNATVGKCCKRHIIPTTSMVSNPFFTTAESHALGSSMGDDEAPASGALKPA